MNLTSLATRARLGGAMLAASALVIAPPIALATQATAASQTCTKATKTVIHPVDERQAYGDKVFGVKGNVIVKLCTSSAGTKVFQTATQLKPIDNETARVALTVKAPTKEVVRGTTIVKRSTLATVTTKWNNVYRLQAVMRTVITPKGKVSVYFSYPKLVK